MSEGICCRCHTPMYHASNGMYECRNFDCPLGTEKKYKASLKLGESLLRELSRLPPSRFASVMDLALVVDLCNESVPLPNGKDLQAIKDRLLQ